MQEKIENETLENKDSKNLDDEIKKIITILWKIEKEIFSWDWKIWIWNSEIDLKYNEEMKKAKNEKQKLDILKEILHDYDKKLIDKKIEEMINMFSKYWDKNTHTEAFEDIRGIISKIPKKYYYLVSNYLDKEIKLLEDYLYDKEIKLNFEDIEELKKAVLISIGTYLRGLLNIINFLKNQSFNDEDIEYIMKKINKSLYHIWYKKYNYVEKLNEWNKLDKNDIIFLMNNVNGLPQLKEIFDNIEKYNSNEKYEFVLEKLNEFNRNNEYFYNLVIVFDKQEWLNGLKNYYENKFLKEKGINTNDKTFFSRYEFLKDFLYRFSDNILNKIIPFLNTFSLKEKEKDKFNFLSYFIKNDFDKILTKNLSIKDNDNLFWFFTALITMFHEKISEEEIKELQKLLSNKYDPLYKSLEKIGWKEVTLKNSEEKEITITFPKVKEKNKKISEYVEEVCKQNSYIDENTAYSAIDKAINELIDNKDNSKKTELNKWKIDDFKNTLKKSWINKFSIDNNWKVIVLWNKENKVQEERIWENWNIIFWIKDNLIYIKGFWYKFDFKNNIDNLLKIFEIIEKMNYIQKIWIWFFWDNFRDMIKIIKEFPDKAWNLNIDEKTWNFLNFGEEIPLLISIFKKIWIIDPKQNTDYLKPDIIPNIEMQYRISKMDESWKNFFKNNSFDENIFKDIIRNLI